MTRVSSSMTESISATEQQLDRAFFIPYRKADLLQMCLHEWSLTADQKELFEQFYRLLENQFHLDFHKKLESLKAAYGPLDPDSDTRPLPDGISASATEELAANLEQILTNANYRALNEKDLAQALEEESLFKIRLQVDFDDFDEVVLYSRGESIREVLVSSSFGLRKKKIEFRNYDRVVLFLRFKSSLDQGAANRAVAPGSIVLKLFQNVPKADLEMLFPNTKIRMRNLDKLMIGVPALVSGIVMAVTKLGATFVLLGALLGYWLGISSTEVTLTKTSVLALLASIATVGGYIWKQFSSFKNRKLRFTQALTENLYFKNLDNNQGVFHRLIDDAEEEECKEAMLAYYFLLRSDRPVTATELDQQVENWFSERWQCELDFDIEDALNKLESLQLVDRRDSRFSAKSLPDALRILDQKWDNYFSCVF